MQAKIDTKEIERFHRDREASLKKNWLVVVGLEWLKEGENSVGSAEDSDVRLPASCPAHFAKIYRSSSPGSGKNEIEILSPEGASVGDQSAKKGQRYELATDKTEKPTKVSYKSVSFYLIDRPNGVGVRIKDSESAALKNFKGLNWWPVNASAQVVGKWVAFKEPKKMKVPDILGNEEDSTVKGLVEFTWEGQKVSLTPLEEDGNLFFVFRDQTAGKESYGAARFLDAQAPNSKGEVVLDFNKAYNPPCAYIAFATCPLPPKENILKVPVKAGEMKYSNEH